MTNYEEYLKSEYWYALVRAKRHSVGNKCEKCGSTHRLEVHHLTYERLGQEKLMDLQVLCSYHHKQVHGIETLSGQMMKRKHDILKGILRQAIEASNSRYVKDFGRYLEGREG